MKFPFRRFGESIVVFVLGYITGFTHRSAVFPVDDQTRPSQEDDPIVVTDPIAVADPIAVTDGWKAIHVFYGQKITDGIPHNTSQTQANQDKIVVDLLHGKMQGYFLDLAANDALDMSNTYALERQYQWKGLCIEANPRFWRNLTFVRDCQVVGAAVGQTRMEQVSFEMAQWGGVGGGIVGSNFDNKRPTGSNTAVSLYTVPLQEILDLHHVPHDIDYLSLDVEGAEDYIMESFPFDRYSVKIMTVERPKPNFHNILKAHGYACVGRISDFGETLWIREAVRQDLDMDSVKHNAKLLGKC